MTYTAVDRPLDTVVDGKYGRCQGLSGYMHWPYYSKYNGAKLIAWLSVLTCWARGHSSLDISYDA